MKIYSHSIQGKRPSNEDNHIHILNINGDNINLNPINFFAVFDGHGGKIVSKYLKEYLPSYFIKKTNKNIFSKTETSIKYFNKIYNAIQNKLMIKHPRAIQYSGSTACVCIEYKDKLKNKLWILNVGDSRIIKCNKSNIAIQLSQDHKPNSPEERLRIEKLGGEIKFDGSDWRIKDLSLSRAFGDIDCTPYVTHLPEVYSYNIDKGDKFIILACDGLWDVLSNQDVVDFVNTLIINKFKGNYSKELVEYAYKKGSLDNITSIVYLL
jgi:serine/threonine protein phosphatase PrpC